ncbi:hypothetical protein L21_0801 [Methanoculleus chikugoensis]|uniref:Uncharacterized protein n=1 Tax=Methanoculleus chikugoensis TaxID=118126 RepID=A0A1M4MJ22_9EURY|nr:hypothetical protein [Methanoculleus chikugoensis]NMA09726.1 hypothetical protein [Methanomicrobiales archaeon]SCL74914.1 hypothetical protein L21_0801 [Methanoculleus chikugoensis]
MGRVLLPFAALVFCRGALAHMPGTGAAPGADSGYAVLLKGGGNEEIPVCALMVCTGNRLRSTKLMEC